MSTPVPAAESYNISHAVLIDLTLGANVYHISNAYDVITVNSTDYTQLGAFLTVGEVADDLKTTNGDIVISLNGIPSDGEVNLVDEILGSPVKGGEVVISRVFWDTTDPGSDQPFGGSLTPYQRYKGIITNFSIDEGTNYLTGEFSYTVNVTCASLNTVLENRITGQRTNSTDRQKYYPDDISFDRVEALQNTSFDFGKDYVGGRGYGGGGGGGGGIRDEFIVPNIP